MQDWATHHRKLEQMYAEAPVNHTVPSTMTVREGGATVELALDQKFWHAAGSLHGSLYFKALDDAAFFAASSVVQEAFLLTAGFEVELLAVVRCPTVRAEGIVEGRQGRKVRARAEMFDDAGQLVARGKGLFILSRMGLGEVEAYRLPPGPLDGTEPGG